MTEETEPWTEETKGRRTGLGSPRLSLPPDLATLRPGSRGITIFSEPGGRDPVPLSRSLGECGPCLQAVLGIEASRGCCFVSVLAIYFYPFFGGG